MPEGLTIQERTLRNMLVIRVSNRIWSDVELHPHEKAILEKAKTDADLEWIGAASTSVQDILKWLNGKKTLEPAQPAPAPAKPPEPAKPNKKVIKP